MLDDENIVKKYSLAEVVLFLIFAAGVVISLLLVQARGRIDLSEPVVLDDSGLAAPVPSGPGWESQKAWVYERPNRFSLTAVLGRTPQRVAEVKYQYLLAAEGIEPAEFLQNTATAANYRVSRRGRISNGVDMYWVQVYASRGLPDTVIGVAQLPHGRAIVLHVRAGGDHLLAMKLFRTLAPQIVFTPQERIVAGAEFIGGLKSAGLSRIMNDGATEDERAFLISDNSGQPRGFQIVRSRVEPDAGTWGVLKVERVHYITGTRGLLSRGYFECSETCDRYIWHTRRSRMRPGRTSASEVELAADGTLRISGGSLAQDAAFRPVLAAPEVLIEQIARRRLDHGPDEMLIDILFEEGSIAPALVEKVDCTQDEDNLWRAAYCIRVRYIDGADSQTRFYFDEQKRLAGRIDGRGRSLVWELSDRRRLTEAFGDLGRFVGADGTAR